MSNSILVSPLPPRGGASAAGGSSVSGAAGGSAPLSGSGVVHAGHGGGVVLSAAAPPSRLSPAEMAYVSGGVLCNLRADGRARLDYRPLAVETGVVPHANGSARLKLGTAATDVLVAVNLSMAVPDPEETSALGKVVCSVEHSAACAVELDERAVQSANAHLTAELQRVLSESGALPLRSLVIIPDQQVWVVHVDVLVMDNGGNLLDAIVMAVKAALLTTTIPPLEIITGDGGAPEITLNDDPFSHLPLPHAARLPLAVTLSKVAVGTAAEWIIDASSDEEQCSSVRLTLSLAPDGRLCGVSKSGVGTLQLPALDAIMEHASQLGVQLNKLLAAEVRRAQGETEEEAPAATVVEPVPVAAAASQPSSSSSASSKKKKKAKAAAQQDTVMVE